MKFIIPFLLFLMNGCVKPNPNLIIGSWKMISLQHMESTNPSIDSTSFSHEAILNFKETGFYINNKYVGQYTIDNFMNLKTTINEIDLLKMDTISWESKCYGICIVAVKYSIRNDTVLTLFSSNLYAKFHNTK